MLRDSRTALLRQSRSPHSSASNFGPNQADIPHRDFGQTTALRLDSLV
jgi:hypothetical protein